MITSLIQHLGYTGVFFWMLLESACIPIPSEAVMPFAGAMIALHHTFNLYLLALVGALGNLAGSALAYWIGAWKGRAFFRKYGKYVLISSSDLEIADRWFVGRGQISVFLGRILPIVRTFISLPAGISHMPFGRFCAFTFVGALIWCYALAWAGLKLGQHWDTLGRYTRIADLVIAAVLIVLIALWIRRRLKSPTVDASEQADATRSTSPAA